MQANGLIHAETSFKELLSVERRVRFSIVSSGVVSSCLAYLNEGLSGVVFSGAGFSIAGFSGTVFWDAGFSNAGFSGTVFWDAGFSGARFSGAGFSGAVSSDVVSSCDTSCHSRPPHQALEK